MQRLSDTQLNMLQLLLQLRAHSGTCLIEVRLKSCHALQTLAQRSLNLLLTLLDHPSLSARLSLQQLHYLVSSQRGVLQFYQMTPYELDSQNARGQLVFQCPSTLLQHLPQVCISLLKSLL